MTGLVAEANDAESAFANPAGMARLKGTHMTVQTMMVRSFANFDIDESKTTVDGGDPDRGENPTIIPSIYYVRELNDKWNLGASLSVPSGFGSNYGGKWAGRYNTVDFSLVYVALSGAVSYRVNDKLSLGMAVAANYTAEESEVKIPQPLGETDGKIKSDLDGVGVSVTLSALYEFSEQTRVGVAWTSDSDADLEGNVELRNLGPVFGPEAEARGITSINTEITNTLPQRVLAGIYHQFDSGKFITLDAMWMKFSDFSVSDISLDGNNVNVDVPEIYDDIWAVTAGMGFPVSDKLTYKIGAMWVSQAVDDEDRGFSIRLDEMWGVGAGLSYELAEGRMLDLNATFIDVGESPVDTGDPEPTLLRVAGENDDPYALLVELTYHF